MGAIGLGGLRGRVRGGGRRGQTARGHLDGAGLYDVAGNIGGQLQPAAVELYDAAIQPAAKNLYMGASGIAEAVGYFGNHIHNLVAADDGHHLLGAEEFDDSSRTMPWHPSKVADLESTLQDMGYPMEQAQAAARR